MQIRFLANSKGKSQTSGGESDAGDSQDDEMLEKAVDTVVELGQASTSMRQRLDFSSLVKQLESRSAKQIAMDRVAVATPIRGEELTKLLGGIMDILREAGKQHAEQAARDMEIEKMFSDDLFEDF